MNDKPIDSDNDNNESSISRLFNILVGKGIDNYQDKIRKEYSEQLNTKGIDEPSEEEIAMTRQQFVEFALIQMLRSMAIQIHGHNANNFMFQLVDQFIDMKRNSVMLKLEIDSIEQQDSPIERIVSQELMKKERDIIRKRLMTLYDQFDKNIKNILRINDSDIPNDTYGKNDVPY